MTEVALPSFSLFILSWKGVQKLLGLPTGYLAEAYKTICLRVKVVSDKGAQEPLG